MARGDADRVGCSHFPPFWPFPLRFVPSEGVSLGVVGVISSHHRCAFILLSHPRFCAPHVYHTHYLIVLPHLTSPQLVGSAGVLSHTPLACILPTDLTLTQLFDPCIYRGPRGYLVAHSQPHLPFSRFPFHLSLLLQCFSACSFISFLIRLI
jgi:hypothetical protein